MFEINVGGIAEGLEAVLPPMIEAGQGKICLLGSVAGYRGLPTSPAYCGTKAAIIALGESLKPELDQYGVTLQVACPGFVRSEATAINEFPMPFLMETEDAAEAFYRGLVGHDRFEITFPKIFAVILKTMTSLPYWLFFRLMRPLVPKPGED
jgi:short-subunit dehydrogenase